MCDVGQARLVMRQRGNFRLLLNANLWPHMPVSMMDGGKASCLLSFPCRPHCSFCDWLECSILPEGDIKRYCTNGIVFSFLPFCIAASFSVLILIVKALVKALVTTCGTCLTAGGHVSMH